MIAPWRIERFRQQFPGRREMIAYCEEKEIPVKASIAKPYSSDENCLHISYEAGKLEDLSVSGVELVEFGMTVSPQQAPDKIEQVAVGFESGVPVSVGGRRLGAYRDRGRVEPDRRPNGIGRVDMVENRFVGMKSRGVYESPGMTILYEAHRLLEQLTLDRDLVHLRDRLAPEVAEMVYYGFWYHAKMDALMAFIRQAQQPVTRRGGAQSLQGHHDGRQPLQPQQSLRRRDRHHGVRRPIQPDRRGRLPADPGAPSACRPN